MKKYLFFLTIPFFLITFSIANAEDAFPDLSKEKNLIFKDPFISHLPKKEIATTEGTAKSQVKDTKAAKPIVPPKFQVSGIVWNTDRPQAIVNNKVIAIGDQLENATIVSIDKSGIEISFQGVLFIVKPDNQVIRSKSN